MYHIHSRPGCQRVRHFFLLNTPKNLRLGRWCLKQLSLSFFPPNAPKKSSTWLPPHEAFEYALDRKMADYILNWSIDTHIRYTPTHRSLIGSQECQIHFYFLRQWTEARHGQKLLLLCIVVHENTFGGGVNEKLGIFQTKIHKST